MFDTRERIGHTAVQAPEKRTQNATLIWCTHQERKTRPLRTGGTTITMHIRISRAGYLVVYDMIDLGNVKTTRCDVRGK